MLSQLVYTSDVRDLGSGGVQEVLNSARRHNQANCVTGLLLYNEDHFLQCLEGGREQVTETFGRIAADRRHMNVTLMSVGDLDERGFPDWSMAYVGGSAATQAVLRRYQPTAEFDPAALSAEQVAALVRRLHGLYGVEK